LGNSVKPVVELLESRRLLSAVDLSSVPEGLKLPDGGWLFVNSAGSVSETKADGSLDMSFGQDGTTTVPGVIFGGQTMSQIVDPFAMTSNGDILVVGGESGAAVVARFHADGTIDSTFGDKGVASAPLGSGNPFFFALKNQADGKILPWESRSFKTSVMAPSGSSPSRASTVMDHPIIRLMAMESSRPACRGPKDSPSGIWPTRWLFKTTGRSLSAEPLLPQPALPTRPWALV